MAQASDFSTPQIRKLQQMYLRGDLNDQERVAFEEEFPHLKGGNTQLLRTQEEQIGIEGGGLQERFGPLGVALAPVVGPGMALAPFIGEAGGEPIADVTQQLGGPARTPPTGGQAAAEMAGAIPGTVLGARFGLPGRVAGAGLPTFGMGVASGRTVKDAFFDALQASMAEGLSIPVAAKAREAVIPRMGAAEIQAAKQTGRTGESIESLVREGPAARELARGERLQAGIQAEVGGPRTLKTREIEAGAPTPMGTLYREAQAKFDPVKTGVPDLDIRDIEAMARANNVSLPPLELGAVVSRGVLQQLTPPPVGWPAHLPWQGTSPAPYSQVSFDDAMTIRSQMSGYIRTFRKLDPPKAAIYTQLERALDRKMSDAADAVGLLPAYREANQFYKTDYIPRVVPQVMQDVIESSGENIAPTLVRASVDDLKDFFKAVHGLGGDVPTAVDSIRAGTMAWVLEQARDKRTQIIRPQPLVNILSRIDVDAREWLFGKEAADAFMDFAKAYATGKVRAGIALTGAGEGMVAGTIAGAGGRALAPAALETLNESKMLAGFIVNRPTIAKAMAVAVLTGRDDALRRFGLTGTAKTAGVLRLVGTQALAQASLQAGMDVPGLLQRLGYGASPSSGALSPTSQTGVQP